MSRVRARCRFGAAVLALAVIGCSDDKTTSTGSRGTTASATADTKTIPAPPAHTIGGTITYTGDRLGSHHIYVVAGLVGAQGPPRYNVVLDAPGPYLLTGVEDGTYFVLAFIDTDDNHGPPQDDDPQGFFDANGDHTFDPVKVTGGVGVAGIDVTLSTK